MIYPSTQAADGIKLATETASLDEAADDLRLRTRRDEDAGGSEGKFAVAGDWAGRELLGEGVLVMRCSWAIAVDMGVRRVLWFGLGAPQGCCWLIERVFP